MSGKEIVAVAPKKKKKKHTEEPISLISKDTLTGMEQIPDGGTENIIIESFLL